MTMNRQGLTILCLSALLFVAAQTAAWGDLTVEPKSNSMVFDMFNMSWCVTPRSTLIVNIQAKHYGYFALGYAQTMKNADMNIVQILDQDPIVRDYWSKRHGRPKLDDNNDVTVLGTDTDGSTYINVKFERPLKTDDPEDQTLVQGQKRKVSFAWSDTPTVSHHEENFRVLDFTVANISKINPSKSSLTPGTTTTASIIKKAASGTDTLLIHGVVLTICWCFLAMMGIFVSFYRYKRYPYWLHPFLFILVAVGTWADVACFMIQQNNFIEDFNKGNNPRKKAHFAIGVAILGLVGLQMLLGLFSRILQACTNAHPKFVRISAWMHKILGYLTILLCQANSLIGWWWFSDKRKISDHSPFWIVLAWTVLMWILYIIRAFTFPKLESTVYVPHNVSTSFPADIVNKINHLPYNSKELKDYPFVIFGNYVWDLSRLIGYHPAGNQIVEKLKGREIDRFLYGMYSPQYLDNFIPYSHSFKSLQAIGTPLFRLQPGPSVFVDTPDYLPYAVHSVQEFSTHTSIVNFKPLTKGFNYVPPTDLSFLGQYHTVHAFGLTRLYTTIHSLQDDNRKFCEATLRRDGYLNTGPAHGSAFRVPVSLGEIKTMEEVETHRNMKNDLVLPLVIKRYEDGAFTSQFFKMMCNQQFVISAPMGKGMSLGAVPPGNISIIAGGTGLWPFIDLIDLLYKNTLLMSGTLTKEEIQTIYALSPVLMRNPFANYVFHIYYAIAGLEQIYNLHLGMLRYVAIRNPSQLKLFFKIKNTANLNSNNLTGIHLIPDRFDDTFITRYGLHKGQQMVYVCGPPKINNAVLQGFNKLGVDPSRIFIL